jgi:hypothetical protein
MSSISDILNGWKNYLFEDDEVVLEEAKRRASICDQCEYKKKGLHGGIMKDYTIKEIEGYYCDACAKCPLSTKVRSENHSCPKNKW